MIKNNTSAKINLYWNKATHILKPFGTVTKDVTNWDSDIERFLVQRWSPNLTYVEDEVKTVASDVVKDAEKVVLDIEDEVKSVDSTATPPTEATPTTTTTSSTSKGGK